MNDWKLKLSNKLLAENKYNYSDFVEFIQNQGKKEEKSNFDLKNICEILEEQIEKEVCNFIKITSLINLNFDIHLRIIKKYGMPSYLVRSKTILETVKSFV